MISARTARLGFALAILVLGASSARPQGRTEATRGQGKASLTELADDRLLHIAWAREQIDLDYDGALEAYAELARRPRANLRVRHRAILRILDIHRSRVRLHEIVPLMRELAEDQTLPADNRRQFERFAKLFETHGPLAREVFERQKSRFEASRRSLGGKAHSRDRDRLRQQFMQDLNAAMRDLKDSLRPDLARGRSRSNPLLPAPRGPGADWQKRRRELWSNLMRLGSRLKRLEANGKTDSSEYLAVEAERRQLEEQYRALMRRLPTAAPSQRRAHELRQLRIRIDQLDEAGDYSRANSLIDEAFRLEGKAPQRRSPRLSHALRDPVHRRATIQEIVKRLPGLVRRLEEAGRKDEIAVLKEFQSDVEPLLAAKRWRDAGRLALAFTETHAWIGNLWASYGRR